MGQSKVEVANQALAHIGKASIASLDEASEAARQVNAFFDRTVYAALSRSRWSFSRKIAALAEKTNDWTERWEYRYDYPTDCLTFLRLIPTVDVQNTEPQSPYQLLGGSVYTNLYQAKAEYIVKSTTTVSMPEPFLDAVSLLLARNVCMPLTRKRSYWADLNEAYERQLALAIMHDSAQEPERWGQDSGGYIDARHGGIDLDSGASPDGSIYWT